MRLVERVQLLKLGREEVGAERRSRAEIEAHQGLELHELLQHARANSSFHGDRLGGLDGAPLGDLPIMRKSDLIDSFDELTTDRRLTKQALEQHVSEMSGEDPLLFGEYRVVGSGGTSGVSCFLAFDRRSWLSVLSPYIGIAAAYGFSPRVLPRYRIAQLTAGGPLHMTNRMASTNRSPAYASLRLDVTSPATALADTLAQFRPDVLTGYPSVIAALAEEQLDGRLDIHPRWILCGSEQLLPSYRSKMREAWAIEAYDFYATTETGGVLAYECPAHEGLHIREDACIAEAVDENQRPVPDGQPATGLLVTSWLNRTVPIIRYLIDDPVTLAGEPCRCGRSSKRILKLTGRLEDTIILDGRDGRHVRVHPNHFEETIEERAEIARYQVLHQPHQITVSAVTRNGYDEDWVGPLTEALAVRLRSLGADPPPIRVKIVGDLERPDTIGAKLKVIRSET